MSVIEKPNTVSGQLAPVFAAPELKVMEDEKSLKGLPQLSRTIVTQSSKEDWKDIKPSRGGFDGRNQKRKMCLSPDLDSTPQRSRIGVRRHSDAENLSARDMKLMTSYGDSYTTDAVNILRLGP